VPATRFQFADFELDLARYELRHAGSPVKLEKIPMELLILLIRRKGELVSREEIIEKLWGQDVFVDTEQGINTAIRKIRQALHDDPEEPHFVQTVVGRGYRFIPAVHEEAPGPEQGPASEAVPAAAISSPRPGSRARLAWMVVALALVAALVALGVGAVRGRLFSREVPPIRSLAVLPLENLTGDPAQEYFADGMTDALITDLGQVSALHVISRTSAMQYKGTKKFLLPQIARELNVDAVVEGTVTRSGSRVRIDVQLIEAATDRHLWAKAYERELTDILVLQADVARAITGEIQIKLTPDEETRLQGARRVNPAAYDALVRGRYLWNKRDEESLHNAMDQFRQTIDADPTYAAAYVGLADCYNQLGYNNYLSPEDSFPRAKAAGLKALELDPSSADAHASLGFATMYFDWDFQQAEKEFRRAIDLNRNAPTAHQWYGYLLTAMEHPKEALAEIEQARKLDPLSVPINTDAGFMYYYSGRSEEALRFVRTALEMNPKFPLGHFWLGRIYTSQGRYDDALAEFTAVGPLRSWQPTMSSLGFLYGVWGKPAEARKILDEFDALKKQGHYQSHYAVGLVYAGLGRRPDTFLELEKAYVERSHWLVWLKRDPRWDSVRGDPRFKALVRRVGLPN
jgi:TolB-like protein/DNA-binding winged helix-turn-helix (wHTH) protein/Tfp pilus assembly protein PilF